MRRKKNWTVAAVARQGNRGYREYRGRRQGGGSVILKAIICLLAILLVAGVLFMLILGKYVEYTDEGVRFNPPWTQAEVTEEPLQSDPLVIVPPDPTPEPTPEPEPVLGVVEVTAAQIADGTAAEAVAQAGGTGLVVEMKNAYGRLNWNSEVERGMNLSTTIAKQTAEGLQELAETGELYLVARVNCFRDQALASAGVGGPLMTRGGNVWYDANGLRWVSPADDTVREYLTALCLELAELGFDEILLECAGFPYYGEVHVLAESQLRPTDLTAPVATFWQELKSVLVEKGIKLSVLATEEMITGTDQYSGIGPELMVRYADRVWVLPAQTEGVDYAALLEQAGMGEVQERLVVLGQPSPDEAWAAMCSPAGTE